MTLRCDAFDNTSTTVEQLTVEAVDVYTLPDVELCRTIDHDITGIHP